MNKKNKQNARRRKNRNNANSLTFSNNTNVYNAHQIVRFTPDIFGFPDRLLTKLRYHTFTSINSLVGALAFQLFRWNSTFDPDFTGTGHQPLYRDTFASLYDQYAVVRARATVKFSNATASTWVVGVGTDDDSTPTTTLDTIAEQSHSMTTSLTPLSGSKSFHTFNINWDCETVLNIDPFASQTYKTLVGANPTETSFLTVFGADLLAPASTFINVDIILEQEVLWTELSTPTQS
jgi:hypothetical protein